MLVLSRKLGQKIIIGRDIIVTVVAIDRGKVRLGIEAPEGVSVHREEIANRIREQESKQVASEAELEDASDLKW